MLRLYIKLFSISYDSLISFSDDINDPLLWNKKRKSQNEKINSLIFEFVSKQKDKSLSDQFRIDMINFFLYSSFNLRKYKLFKNKHFTAPRLIFIFCSLMYNVKISLIIVSQRIYHLLFTEIKYPKLDHINKAILLIGFPEHSFSKNDTKYNYNSSHIELLFNNKFIDTNTELISFDEYGLKKLKEHPKNKNISIAKRQERHKIFRVKKFNLSIKFFFEIFLLLIKTLKKHKFKPISFYSFYITRILISKELKSLYTEIEKRKINFKVIFIGTYDLGNIKYEEGHKFHQFNYSRNNIYPSSQNIISNELNQSFNFTTQNILEEVELDIFTLVYRNSLGFSYHAYFYSYIRNQINEKFRINLDTKINKPKFKEKTSNLGYAFLERLFLKKEKINVIIFDIPAESESDNISRRGIHGMYSQLEDFIKIYLIELIGLLNKPSIEIYYKGKYSNNNSSNFISKVINKEGVKVNIINEYSKIDLENGLKFDFAICQPFTSIYLNFKEISKNSIYYVPDRFLDFIGKGINDTCYGSNVLTKKINKYEKNRR